MKNFILPAFLFLTACETTCKPEGSFTRSDLSLKAQNMVAGPAAKSFTPVIKAETETSGQKIVMPKAETFKVAETPKTEKVDVTAKLLIEKMQIEQLPSGKVDMMPTGSITPAPMTPAPMTRANAKANLMTMNLIPENKSALTFRFPESKDELTAYEQNRLQAAINSDAKKIIVTVAGDNSRTGFESLAAVKKRSDSIKSFLPKSSEISVTFAPMQEANTVKIEIQ